MAFVNERISKEDRQKYNLDAIDNNSKIVSLSQRSCARHWTIDKERDLYLRKIESGREDNFSEMGWIFYRRGELLKFHMKYADSCVPINGPGRVKWLVYKFYALEAPSLSERAPEDIKQIRAELEEALIVYKDFGALSQSTTCETTITYAEGVLV